MADEELKALLMALVERLEERMNGLATKDDITAIRAEMATKEELAELSAKMATKEEVAELREGQQRIERKLDDSIERTAILIQQDRRQIDELRGGLDMLGKRFDAFVKAAE